MLFNSINFLVFFPIVVLLYYTFPHKIRTVWLLIASYYFYMSWNPKYALLIVLSTVVTYISGICISTVRDAKHWSDKKIMILSRCCMVGSLLINLGILAFFKYANFFIEAIDKILNRFNIVVSIQTFDILLPVGISFYTFQALSYTLDVYNGETKAERNFIKYALFVSFFPQLVAGPIERSSNLLSQINEKHEFKFENVREGLMLVLWGLFLKMVISDRIAIFVDVVYGNYNEYGGVYLIVATVLFAIQIYCDFGGYSMVALGAAKVMGFQLTDNFNSPYFSRSTSEFWRRWHISLFSWFRDYIYIPLGGSKKGKLRKYINIMIVFLISGLWHGASFAFIAWGALNGLYQIIGDLTKPIRDRIVIVLKINRNAFSHKLLQMIWTFIIVDFSWIFFRAGGIRTSFNIIKSMFSTNNVWILFDDSLFNIGLSWRSFFVLICSIMILIYADMKKYRGFIMRDIIIKQGVWLRWSILLLGIAAIYIFGIWGSRFEETAFIYFDF